MKIIVILVVSFFSTLAFANELVELNAGLFVYECSQGSCITPVRKGQPISVELTNASPTSEVLIGNFEMKQVVNGFNYSTLIQVVKIPSGPSQGYLVQVFLSTCENETVNCSSGQLGSVLVENLSQLNMVSWKSTTYVDEIPTNVAVITIGPK